MNAFPTTGALTIVPDTVENGAMASAWNLTVENAIYLNPTSGGAYLSFDTNRTVFSNSMGWFPDLDVGQAASTTQHADFLSFQEARHRALNRR